MIEVKKIIDGIYHFEVKLSLLYSPVTVYLIKEPQGVVIDPGPASLVPYIQEAMQQLGMSSLKYVIPTHIHVDHAGASGKLAQLFPEANIVFHPAARKHMIDPSKLIDGTKAVFGPDFESVYGPVLPVPEKQIKVPEDGEVVKDGSRELQILWAPGHASHHITIYDRSVDGLFCGEALGQPVDEEKHFVLPLAAPQTFDEAIYMETIEKLEKVDAKMLFYPHGGVVGHNAAKLITQLKESTPIFGDIMRQVVKEGGTEEQIGRRVRELASSRFGKDLSEADLYLTIGGYISYFKKKGLV